MPYYQMNDIRNRGPDIIILETGKLTSMCIWIICFVHLISWSLSYWFTTIWRPIEMNIHDTICKKKGKSKYICISYNVSARAHKILCGYPNSLYLSITNGLTTPVFPPQIAWFAILPRASLYWKDIHLNRANNWQYSQPMFPRPIDGVT